VNARDRRRFDEAIYSLLRSDLPEARLVLGEMEPSD
jgi:hypothetical protein